MEVNKEILIFSFVMLIVITSTLIVTLSFINGVETFKNSCESFGGSFWEIANVTCSALHQNCRYMCNLNGETFSMDDLGSFGVFTYSHQICIKDCSYKNKQDGDVRCVC